ncbi:MAG: hypothetical protein IJ518_08010 [Clostridia bacterium]|nr:hypothetical protein [Clostridia bacterium]
MGKYAPLTNFLLSANQSKMTLTYSEIEKVIGFALPKSAYQYDRWWMNNDKTHTQSAAWGDAGYDVETVVLGNQITFVKK